MEMKNACLGAAALLVLIQVCSAQPTTHTVGGSSRWNLGVDYTTWAAGETFKSGDSLLFTYTPNVHDVLELGSKSAYDNCDKSNPLTTLTSGSDTVSLSSTGTRWFVCGKSDHCSQGMKVEVTVSAASSTPTPTPPTTPSTPTPGNPSTPTTPSTPTPTPGNPSTPTTPSNPTDQVPPPPPNAAASVSAMAALLVAGAALLA